MLIQPLFLAVFGPIRRRFLLCRGQDILIGLIDGEEIGRFQAGAADQRAEQRHVHRRGQQHHRAAAPRGPGHVRVPPLCFFPAACACESSLGEPSSRFIQRSTTGAAAPHMSCLGSSWRATPTLWRRRSKRSNSCGHRSSWAKTLKPRRRKS